MSDRLRDEWRSAAYLAGQPVLSMGSYVFPSVHAPADAAARVVLKEALTAYRVAGTVHQFEKWLESQLALMERGEQHG